MSDPRPQELPADWLDHLVLDMTEFEVLAARLEQAFGVLGPAAASRGPISPQILDVLVRVSETSGALHDMGMGRLRSLAATIAAASSDEEPVAPSAGDPEPAEADRRESACRRVPMSVR